MIGQRLKCTQLRRALCAGFLAPAWRRPPPWLPVACGAIPALLLLVQIVQNWVNIPYWDEWGLIANLRISFQSGTLRPVDLFAQDNDSRLVLSQLLALPLARLTHWDLRAEMAVTFAILCLISRALWLLFAEIRSLPRPVRIACLLVCNCLLFSPIQHETLLWGINLSLVLPPLLLLLALRVNLSARPLWNKVGANIFLCFASTFSNANGMGNWLLAFPGFVQGWGGSRRRWLWYGVYCAGAVGTLFLYFWGYYSQLSFAPVLKTPVLLIAYFFCWLGAPLALTLGSSAWIVGGCLSLVFLALSWVALRCPEADHNRKVACAFVAIGCYAGLAGAATALGRVGLPFQWALSSRYTTSSTYLCIAIVGLSALHYARSTNGITPPAKRFRQVAAMLIVLGILGGSFATYYRGMRAMKGSRHSRAQGRAALLFSEILPHNPDLKILAPHPDKMISQYRALLRCGMARDPFIPPQSIPQLKPQSQADQSRGCFQVCQPEGGRLRMKGWALCEGKEPAPFVLFAYRVEGTAAIPFSVAPTGDSNPALARRGLRNCGFEITCEPKLPPGRVEISAWAVNPQCHEVAQLELLHSIQLPGDIKSKK